MSTMNIGTLSSAELGDSGMELAFDSHDDKDNNDANADTTVGLQLGSMMRTWTQISGINYYSSQPLDIMKSGQALRRRNLGIPPKDLSVHDLISNDRCAKSQRNVFANQFPVNVTNLMNEEQLWGCFYIFPELYDDAHSPTVPILKEDQVVENERGVLSRDLVACCLSYLARTPILKDFVYIKLNLARKGLLDIDVLRNYRYIVYLDLSENRIENLNVLSYLPYLQYLSVSMNKLKSVLEYEPAQWFLTEVHYKSNIVKNIRDLSAFWSITVLDLSHNNIKRISGLNNLMFLRRLDLSFNHIQRLENLNNLKLLWLDVSYNNISSFEHGHKVGLKTLLHLNYLNVNENKLSTFKLFAGCSRFLELHARNNRFSPLLDLIAHMNQLRRLTVLDLRTNPISSSPNYKHVIFNTFPAILKLDGDDVDAQKQREYIMKMSPSMSTVSLQRVMRLLYIEQMTRVRVSSFTPPADTNGFPIVIIVGPEAIGKGALIRRLAAECPKHIERATLHTTAKHHQSGHFLHVSRSHFDEMLLAGELLTYSEMRGHSYGLSREEAYVRDGRIRVTTMDLTSALMLRDRGLRPYILLATGTDSINLLRRQWERKKLLPKKKSLKMWEEPIASLKQAVTDTLQKILKIKNLSTATESAKSVAFTSHNISRSYNDMQPNPPEMLIQSIHDKEGPGGGDGDRLALPSSYKSVTFPARRGCAGGADGSSQPDLAGMLIEPLPDDYEENNVVKTMSSTLIDYGREIADSGGDDYSKAWFAFLNDHGWQMNSDVVSNTTSASRATVTDDDATLIIKELNFQEKDTSESRTKNLYEEINRRCPGLFWDTITMDDPNSAFIKAKRIIKQITKTQPSTKPIFCTNFSDSKHYPAVQARLERIQKTITPHRLFY